MKRGVYYSENSEERHTSEIYFIEKAKGNFKIKCYNRMWDYLWIRSKNFYRGNIRGKERKEWERHHT